MHFNFTKSQILNSLLFNLETSVAQKYHSLIASFLIYQIKAFSFLCMNRLRSILDHCIGSRFEAFEAKTKDNCTSLKVSLQAHQLVTSQNYNYVTRGPRYQAGESKHFFLCKISCFFYKKRFFWRFSDEFGGFLGNLRPKNFRFL